MQSGLCRQTIARIRGGDRRSRWCRRRPTAAAHCRARWSRPASIDMRRATVSGPSSPSPRNSIYSGWTCRNRNSPCRRRQANQQNATQINAGTMPVGLWPVNDDPKVLLIGLNDSGWIPPFAIPSPDIIARTTQEYGLSAARYELRLCFAGSPKTRMLQGYLADPGSRITAIIG